MDCPKADSLHEYPIQLTDAKDQTCAGSFILDELISGKKCISLAMSKDPERDLIVKGPFLYIFFNVLRSFRGKYPEYDISFGDLLGGGLWRD